MTVTPADLAVFGGVALFAVVVAFLVGALNPAVTIARLLGRDLRSSGSGNPGATNAGRVLGVGWGVLVAVLDVAKGWLPTWLAGRSLGSQLMVAVGIAVVAGHMWSPFLRGRGGKGVATTLGVFLALEPRFAVLLLLVFAILVAVFRVTGKASILTAGVVVMVGLVRLVLASGGTMRFVAFCYALLGLMVLFRHRHNVQAWVRLARV